jgi:peptide/nickel transport system ATP-binding protein
MSASFTVEHLTVGFRVPKAEPTIVVRDCGFELREGEILGIAGESGCGKSTAVLSAIGFPIPASVRLAGTARLGNRDLLSLSLGELRGVWGREVSYVAQDATQSLNPLMRISQLLREPLVRHLGLRDAEIEKRSIGLLRDVRIPDPEEALRRYPHQFSGGQQQRIALALALACAPKVLVLDEPTTGLDVTTQAQIAELIRALVRDTRTAAVMISHDLALLAIVCDELSIMYGGEIVEQGRASEVYDVPAHPYAAALIDAVPRVTDSALPVGIPGVPPPRVIQDRCAYTDRCRFVQQQCRTAHPELREELPGRAVRCFRARELAPISSERHGKGRSVASGDETPLLVVDALTCRYGSARSKPAVDGISLNVGPGETLALVGESGSGKSTVLRAIAGLHVPEGGSIRYGGAQLEGRAVHRSRERRRAIQLVFQNPYGSLNPRHSVGAIIERPLHLFRPDLDRASRQTRIRQLLDDVRLDPGLRGRYPHELSGGQRQRVALARAFAADPELILCDEVVSALDVSVQASILELLAVLAQRNATAVLFVTHDLAVVRSIADRVSVMRDGHILESGTTEAVFERPQDDYTRLLLDAAPRPVVSSARA